MKDKRNNERAREVMLPLEWDGWDLTDTAVLQFYEAMWLEDFGVFKAGSKYDCVTIDYGAATITVFDDAGEPTLVQKFRAVPIEE